MDSHDKICFQNLLEKMYGEVVSVQHIEQQSDEKQEASDREIRCYKVHFTRAMGHIETRKIISKEASFLENRVPALLCEQKP
ncbi:unnamed protein product [Rotaria sordida]|uniref:Uncharacterized protein n=1 Tax=Rotaria sordida TaxID=392033 RepID=A0A820IFA4_9BILA|nr:unnamed protein product [Rotaria sordida]